MSEGARLFDPGPAETTYGVGELNQRITRALAAGFPDEVWVRGEIHNFKRSAPGHVYFSLCEGEERRDRQELAVVLFRGDARRVQRELAATPELTLGEGIEVRIRGRVAFYPPQGRVQLVMSAIDPVHTLGRLAADRDRVLRGLAAEGLLERNGRLPVPALPLHVGLVTSVGSAAYNDAVHELTSSGYRFRITVADARVQGRGSARSVVLALRRAARAGVDVVLVVRGGGARTDLATFDDEAVARAVAGMPVPVFTGVGHEIDTCVADHVAHTVCKTPTAAAAAVVEAVMVAESRVEAAWADIARAARARLEAADQRLAGTARHVAGGTRGLLAGHDRGLADRARATARGAGAVVDRSAARAERDAGAVAAVTRQRLRDHGRRLDAAVARLTPERLDAGLRRRDAAVGDAVRRLRLAGRRPLTDATAHLRLAAVQVAAADPGRILARGFTMTRTVDGALVRDPDALHEGDVIVTTFASGRARSVVEAAEHTPTEEHPA